MYVFAPRQNHLQGARDRLDRYAREKAAQGEEVGEEEATYKEVGPFVCVYFR